ncbi:MAG TPA: pitrilysin family protein [Clostridiales bacterium]|nr:pitrilysin family protein [Clostridiales bacterium]
MVKKYVLDNGIRIVCEQIPYLRSVSIGIWVGAGSRNESKLNNGVSHFIEHMLFKGTENRTAKDIAVSIDSIGGQLNAFTGKEYTCYYAKTLDTHIDIAVDVLSDMFFNSRFDNKDISVEKQVIIEEINMYEDTPEELVHDVLAEIMWDGDPLGYSILGTYESLDAIDREKIKSYLTGNYHPNNTVIAIAGNYDEDKMLDLITKYFNRWKNEEYNTTDYSPVTYKSGVKLRNKDTEQIHLCVGFNGIENGSDDIYPLLVVNNVLGGGMSSRLFQKIREEEGLVYSIYSYPSSFKNSGAVTIYAGMNPGQLEQVSRLIMLEIKQLKNRGISESELEKSKEQLKGNYMLGLESTNSRMTSIGKSELVLGYVNTPDEILEKIERVNNDMVNNIINKVFDVEKACVAAVGKIKENIDIASLINIDTKI